MEQLHRRGVRVNKTTVYRELTFLRDEGYIAELDFGEGRKHYEHSQSHHHHLMCVRSKTVEHIDIEDEVRALKQKLQHRFGGKMRRYLIEFFRLCCRALCSIMSILFIIQLQYSI